MQDDQRDAWAKFGQISALGLTAGVFMLGCGWVGILLDRRLGTSPLLASVLFLAGGAVSLWYGILRLLK